MNFKSLRRQFQLQIPALARGLYFDSESDGDGQIQDVRRGCLIYLFIFLSYLECQRDFYILILRQSWWRRQRLGSYQFVNSSIYNTILTCEFFIRYEGIEIDERRVLEESQLLNSELCSPLCTSSLLALIDGCWRRSGFISQS